MTSTKILRKSSVASKLDCSTRTVDRYWQDPRYKYLKFPQPRRIGSRSLGWVESEIDDWIERTPLEAA